jgi:hypothetical protein
MKNGHAIGGYSMKDKMFRTAHSTHLCRREPIKDWLWRIQEKLFRRCKAAIDLEHLPHG